VTVAEYRPTCCLLYDRADHDYTCLQPQQHLHVAKYHRLMHNNNDEEHKQYCGHHYFYCERTKMRFFTYRYNYVPTKITTFRTQAVKQIQLIGNNSNKIA